MPLAAMIDSNDDAVFVVTTENKLERRSVKRGTDDGNFVEILSGLSEGETVITSAAEGLENGMKVTVTLTEGEDK